MTEDDVEMVDVNEQQKQNQKNKYKGISGKDKNDSLPFVEKYRPFYLSGIISHEEILATINRFVEKQNIPHFLFHGPPGTGKTTCILALAHQLYGDVYKSMTLELNASDDRGINIVREKIKDFCGALNSYSNFLAGAKPKVPFKLVILDESDMMTSAAQFALRRVIEKYTKNVRFCLICNQVSKIIPAIQSRCMRFRFSPLKPDKCLSQLKMICNKENILTTDEALGKIIQIGNGDMRKILNLLESTNMTFKGEVNVENVYSSAGLPTPQQIQTIENLVNEISDEKNNFGGIFEKVQMIKMGNGIAIEDLVSEITQRIRDNTDISIKDRIDCFKALAKMDYLSRIGGNEKIILANLIFIIKKINNLNY